MEGRLGGTAFFKAVILISAFAGASCNIEVLRSFCIYHSIIFSCNLSITGETVIVR